MANLSVNDRYTALPMRTRSRARSQDARPSKRHGEGGSRGELLHKLLNSIADEDRAIASLLLTFGVVEELETNPAWVFHGDPPPLLSGRHVTNILMDSPWSNELVVTDKNQYLLTPIRTRLFPKASPGVLRNLLSTPSLRAFTPDQSILPEDSSLLGSPLQSLVPSFDLRTCPYSASTKEICGSLSAHHCDSSAGSCHGPSKFSLPSPPPSAELPFLETFDPRNVCAESSPPGHPAHHDARRPRPSLDTRRSAQSRLSLGPELIPSGLRAAPCSPLLTRPVVHDRTRPLSSVPAARAARPTDLRTHAHRGLAFGVVRDFQRVLDELQGLGHGGSIGAHEPESTDPPCVAQAPGRSAVETTTATLGSVFCGDPVTIARPLGGRTPALMDRLRPPRADKEDCPPKRFASESFPTDGTLLGRTSDSPLAYDRAPTSSAPSASFRGLDDEFISLLIGQATEEEIQAEHLRTIAARLGNVARRKRYLAKAIMGREL
ncbi:hypothetical protein BC628DRAFT_1360656 [Trametes gibbosa]|nr:hypothetical protein BC628DRAFT_1360656 [Trametes gibbosa]